MSPITKQFLAETKKQQISSREEKLLNGASVVKSSESIKDRQNVDLDSRGDRKVKFQERDNFENDGHYQIS